MASGASSLPKDATIPTPLTPRQISRGWKTELNHRLASTDQCRHPDRPTGKLISNPVIPRSRHTARPLRSSARATYTVASTRETNVAAIAPRGSPESSEAQYRV